MMKFSHTQISENIYSIREEDDRQLFPLIYLIIGTEDKALLIDTGCGCGNLYFYLKTLAFSKNLKFIVVNTHNHPEQIGGNASFSTTGKLGLNNRVENLCASRKNKYYTRLMNSNWHWENQVETYKVTKWLQDGEKILLGRRQDPQNMVQVFWTPGHTPDSIVLWYPYANRLFVGDLFYQFQDIMLNYECTDIKEYEKSVRRILQFVNEHEAPIRYSSAKSEKDNQCLPIFKQYHRFCWRSLLELTSAMI